MDAKQEKFIKDLLNHTDLRFDDNKIVHVSLIYGYVTLGIKELLNTPKMAFYLDLGYMADNGLTKEKVNESLNFFNEKYDNMLIDLSNSLKINGEKFMKILNVFHDKLTKHDMYSYLFQTLLFGNDKPSELFKEKMQKITKN